MATSKKKINKSFQRLGNTVGSPIEEPTDSLELFYLQQSATTPFIKYKKAPSKREEAIDELEKIEKELNKIIDPHTNEFNIRYLNTNIGLIKISIQRLRRLFQNTF